MSFTITVAYTGKPLDKAPDGTSLEGVTFETEEEARAFINEHGGAFVEGVEVPVGAKPD